MFSSFDTMNDIVEGIQAIVYEHSFFNIDEMIQYKSVYSIQKNGVIELRCYKGTSRRILRKKVVETAASLVRDYYLDIIHCMKTADSIQEIIDDCDGRITIVYSGGEIVLPRGLESAYGSISSISEKFLENVNL